MPTSCRASLLTAKGRGAIAVIAVTGSRSNEVLAKCFRPAGGRPLTANSDRVRYGDWIGAPSGLGPSTLGPSTLGPSTSRRSTESVVVVSPAVDCWEIQCHGGKAAVEAILADLRQLGVDIVTHTLATDSAAGFNADQQSEMRSMLIRANTPLTAAILLNQTRGAMRRWCESAIDDLRSGEPPKVDRVSNQLVRQLQFAPVARHLITPWNVVVAGPPNVGKSSLMNAILGYRRAITFDQPGTTRDVVSAETAMRGWPLIMRDTAGIRTSDDVLEAEGIRRATASLESADLVLMVIDATMGPLETHHSIVASLRCPVITVWNKSDLIRQPITIAPEFGELPSHHVSAVTGDGIENLTDEMMQTLIPHSPEPDDVVPVTAYQIDCLKRMNRCVELADRVRILRELSSVL